MFRGNIEAPRHGPIYPVGGEPGAQASAKLIKDRTLLGFERNWIGKAGRQGSIANCWSRRMGQSTQTRGFLIFCDHILLRHGITVQTSPPLPPTIWQLSNLV